MADHQAARGARGAADDQASRVVWVAAVVAAVLVATATRYGWHRDELYFVEAGRHLAWGFPDQPALVPLLARVLDAVGGGSLFVVRLAPALAMGFTVVLAARVAAVLGGSARARWLAAVAVALTPAVPTFGHLLSTATFDVVVWLVVLYAVAARLQGGPRWWWLVAGTAGGIGANVKQTVAILAVALAVGLLVAGREHLRDRWLWAAGGIGVVLALPNLAWQAANGWPQAEMAASLRAEHGGPDGLVLSLALLVLVANPVLVPTAVRGGRWLWTHERLRVVGIALPTAVVLALASGGQFYYSVPAVLFALAAGVVARWGSDEASARRRPARVLVAAAAVAVVMLPLALPVLPMRTADALGLASVNDTLAEQHGWDRVVAATAGVYGDVVVDAPDAIVLTANYGEASALRRWGPATGIPTAVVYSGHNGYGWWGPPPQDQGEVVVLVGMGPDAVASWCGGWQQHAVIQMDLLAGEEHGRTVATCRRTVGWAAAWPMITRLN